MESTDQGSEAEGLGFRGMTAMSWAAGMLTVDGYVQNKSASPCEP